MSRIMRRLPVLILSLIIIGFCGYLLFLREHEIKPLGERGDISLRKNPFSEDVRVIDNETGRTIFRYQDGSGIVLKQIDKIPQGEWRIVIEDVGRKEKQEPH